MPEINKTGTKGRLLFLERYLLEHTDDNHALTTEDIISICREHGFQIQRSTVADDMAILSASGLDIIRETVYKNRTIMNAYHIGARLFEMSELRMLVDAVSSSRFITLEKSDLLISKLARLTCEQNRSSLTQKIFQTDRLKTTNMNIFVNMEMIRSAMDLHRKISFHYWGYTPKKEKVLRHNGELYVASPYSLLWNDDRYYMVGWSDKRRKTAQYRVDRMCDLRILENPAVEDESFNAALYSRSVLKMFDEDLPARTVILLCEGHLMQNVLDRFGEDTKTETAGEDMFRATVNVIPSSTFFGWVFQYQGGIIIESPQKIREAFEKTLQRFIEKHRGTDSKV